MSGWSSGLRMRRLYFVKRLSIKEIARRTGRDHNTVRKALRSERPPRYSRPARASKLDPFKEEIPARRGEISTGLDRAFA